MGVQRHRRSRDMPPRARNGAHSSGGFVEVVEGPWITLHGGSFSVRGSALKK